MHETPSACGVGYSKNISNPAFAKHSAPQKPVHPLQYLLFIVPLATLFFLWRGGQIFLWHFIALTAVLVLLVLFPLLRRQRQVEDTAYDGVITFVDRREPVASAARVDPKTAGRMILHTIRIRDVQGREHVHEWMGGLADYRTYYHEGDAVRHHRGFHLPEKYDKSGDDMVVCIACGRMNSMDSRRCGQCGTVLLK